jgi:hypothetical protein
MSEPKHTPGPWKIATAMNRGVTFLFIFGPNQEEICVSGVSQEKIDDQQKADANLISAAPDLLAACKLAHAYLEGGGTVSEWPDVFAALLSAIEKAEGKNGR